MASSSSSSTSSTCNCSSSSTRTESCASAPPNFYFNEKRRARSSSTSSITPFMKIKNSSSHKRCAFVRKCARLVKEQRARFYIMRRCVIMLICWRDYSDS